MKTENLKVLPLNKMGCMNYDVKEIIRNCAKSDLPYFMRLGSDWNNFRVGGIPPTNYFQSQIYEIKEKYNLNLHLK